MEIRLADKLKELRRKRGNTNEYRFYTSPQIHLKTKLTPVEIPIPVFLRYLQ